jgi:hypothetical protein
LSLFGTGIANIIYRYMIEKELQDTKLMDRNNGTPDDQESDTTLFGYDINDIKLSIQETNRAIEKLAIDKERIEKDKKNKK